MDDKIQRNSDPFLRKSYKVLEKIRKKLGREDVRFVIQKSVSSDYDDNLVTYTAMLAPIAEGLAPVTFGGVDKDEFYKQIVDFYNDKISEDQVEIAYLEAKIFENERSTKACQERIEEIKNPKEAESEESSPESEE